MQVSLLVIYEWEMRMGEGGVEGEVVWGLIGDLGVSGDYFLVNCWRLDSLDSFKDFFEFP